MKRLLVLTLIFAAGCGGSPSRVHTSPRPGPPPVTTLSPNPDCSDPDITTHLSPTENFRIVLGDTPRRCPLVVQGGHDVVIQGGEISIPWQNDVGHEVIGNHYGIYLVDQTGEVRVEGVRLGGPDLIVPIVLSEGSGATVTIERVRAVLHSHWQNITQAHGDCIQSWRGPKVLNVDYFTCGTDYFFLQLQPVQYVCGSPYATANCDSYAADIPKRFSFSHINSFNSNPQLDSTRYAFWWDSDGVKGPNGQPARWPITFDSVYAHVAPGRTCANGYVVWPKGGPPPNCSSWPPFRRSQPPGGDFVPASSDVGINYRP